MDTSEIKTVKIQYELSCACLKKCLDIKDIALIEYYSKECLKYLDIIRQLKYKQKDGE